MDNEDDDLDCDSGPPTQIGLVSSILTYIGSCDGYREGEQPGSLNSRQMNAIFSAANTIMEELSKPNIAASVGMGLDAWLASDDTGTSSWYMAYHLAPLIGRGAPNKLLADCSPWPHDPADFGRCVRLLDAVPELRPHLGELSKPGHGKVWNQIAAAWDELEAMYREDLPTGRSERLYQWLKNAARSER